MKKTPDIKLKLSATLLECCIMHEMLQKMRMQHGMFTIEKKSMENQCSRMQKHILCKWPLNTQSCVLLFIKFFVGECTHFNRNPRFLKFLDFPMQIVQQICHVD